MLIIDILFYKLIGFVWTLSVAEWFVLAAEWCVESVGYKVKLDRIGKERGHGRKGE